MRTRGAEERFTLAALVQPSIRREILLNEKRGLVAPALYSNPTIVNSAGKSGFDDKRVGSLRGMKKKNSRNKAQEDSKKLKHA
ncbi:hypothetical protein [Thermoflexus sp.]|uniref:hypothetical protein n=1 Tax=Thermoflexus sp. TaxID=1969742 RepID=UPI002ADD588A|nr:hypothetical protein [Thermoflexus sp.]